MSRFHTLQIISTRAGRAISGRPTIDLATGIAVEIFPSVGVQELGFLLRLGEDGVYTDEANRISCSKASPSSSGADTHIGRKLAFASRFHLSASCLSQFGYSSLDDAPHLSGEM